MSVRRLLALAVLSVPAVFPAIAVAQSQPSLESQVFAKINAARSKKLIFHRGVHSVAWRHSADMSSRGGLSHANADARIAGAPPDPAEANGAPDDGYGRDWCENVTYVNFGTEAEAAGRIYEAWRRSGAHQRCMQDTTLNTGAVGVFWDGSTWWATFIAYLDHTPPGAPAPAAPAAPKERPAATQPPVAATVPERTTTTQPVSESTSPTGGGSANTGSADGTQPEASAAPSSEPESGRILVITEPADEATPPATADTEDIGDVLYAAVTSPKLGVQEVAAAAGALFLGLSLALLRLKRRDRLPRTMRTPSKVDKDAASTSRIPVAAHDGRELAGASQRQRELVRS